MSLIYFLNFISSWATSHHDELKAKGSSLEFKLHKLRFIDLLRQGRDKEALQYSRILSTFSEHVKGKISYNIESHICIFSLY